MNIVFVGLGKVAQGLSQLIHAHTDHRIFGLSRRKDIPHWHFELADTEVLVDADIVFITRQDSDILSAYDRLSPLAPGAMFVHCAGALSTDEPRYRKLACAHPAFSFGNNAQIVAEFKGTPIVLSGEAADRRIVHELFEAIGGHVIQVNSLDHAQYHAALVFASNYLITLANTAKMLLDSAGVAKVDSNQVVLHLMQNTLNNLRDKEPREALTGPIARGDIHTVTSHITAINKHHEAFSQLYTSLAKETIEISSLSDDEKQMMSKVINE